MLASQPCHFPKISAGGGRKSAGTVRSRRMKFCEKGFGGGSHQQAKTDFRRSRRKSVLSLCGNKDTACNFGDSSHRAGYMFGFQTLITQSSKTCLCKYLHHSLHKKSICVKEMIKFFTGLCMRNFIPDGTFRHIQSLKFIGS